VRTYGTLHHLPELSGISGSWFGVEAEPHVIVKLKRWFPRARPNTQGQLVMSDTPEVASELEFMLTRWPLQMTAAAAAHLERRARVYAEAREALLAILHGGKALGGDDWLEPAYPPKVHDGIPWQSVPADIVLATGRTLCGDTLGLGKTFEGLLVLRDPQARPALVVCPPHLQRQWVRETAKFFPTLRTHIVKRSRVYDPAQTREARGYAPDVLIISYAKLAGWVDYLAEAMAAGRLRTVIYDEIHELRNPGSQKYDAATQLARAAQFRMGLTGTIVFNYGGDVHTIISILDEDALGSRDEFTREWGRDLGRGKVGVSDPRALGHHLREQGLHIRRTRVDVGEETPGVERIAHEVDVDQKTMDRLMDDVVDLAELIVRGGDRQDVFQARGDIDWQMRRATGLAKAPYVAAFVRLLLESEAKVVLWGWHRDVYDVWQRKLAQFHPALYTGTESPRQKALSAARFVGGDELDRFTVEDQRAGRLPRWERHEESRVLIMSLRSGAGLDGLQEVCNVGVFGELDWSPAQHDQCVGRLDRDGQEHRVLAYYLHTPDGSDPVVLETLGLKREQGELIRDPTLPLLEHGNDLTDRPRRLAEEVLARRRPRAQTTLRIPRRAA
jgi:hypothetical protein